jgi:biopolymer transport protein ExbB/TolQ
MHRAPHIFEGITTWIGSPASFVLHTLIFIASFLVGVLGLAPWQSVLLVLTTIVSLEAIYLSIFIQMTVNRHARELEEVSEDIEDIQEDVEEISEDVEDIQEDIEEISEDEAEEARKHQQAVTLETMTKDIQRLLNDLEQLKKEQ